MADPLVGALTSELLSTVIDVMKKISNFKSDLQLLKSTLEALLPQIQDLERLDSDLESRHRRSGQITRLKQLLNEGKDLVLKCSKFHFLSIVNKYKYSKKFAEFDASLVRFFLFDVQSESLVLNKQLLVELQEANRKLDRCFSSERSIVGGGGEFSCVVPELPWITVGLDFPLKELKMKVLKEGVTVVGLFAPGGCGKTTLATKLCLDEQIKGIFKENILFLTVSSSPDLKTIVERIFKKMMGYVAAFQNYEDAIKQLGYQLKQTEQEPILLVLDDVWSDTFIEKLKSLDLEGHKILVTSRTDFKVFDTSYSLGMLSSSDSTTLFCHLALPQDKSYERPDDELVDKIVQRCKGYPLLLKVIARSLHGQPELKWYNTERTLSMGGSFFDFDKDLLDCLATTLNDLDGTVLRECFLDLGSFPEDQRIPAAALMDIWVELYELDKYDAYMNLLKLSDRVLVALLEGTRNNAVEIDVNFNERYVVQHDLLRDLAIYQGQGNLTIRQKKRLIMNKRQENLPKTWREHENETFGAHVVSIHTGDMLSSSWPKLQFPETRVLVLNFSATNYFLPQFMEKMEKLKVLIITNYADHQTELNGLAILNYLSNLKRIRLEKVSSRLLDEITEPLKNLQKISLVMCEINNAFTIKISHLFPNLTEIHIDYCDSLVEFPQELCNACNLKALSITNCHYLSALPEDIGQMTDLEVLRLHACTGLLSLPDSVRKLGKLKFLDISECSNIERMPEGIGDLRSLRTLDMWRCSRVKKLPRSAKYLNHLKDVICDIDTSYLWESLLQFVPMKLNIKVPQEKNNLVWLGIDQNS